MAQKTVANVADAQGSPLAVAIEGSGHHIFRDNRSVGEARWGHTMSV